MKKKAIAALTIAGLMALQLPMTAFADTMWTVNDSDKTRTGNLIVDDNSWAAVNFTKVSNIDASIDGYIQQDISNNKYSYGVFSDIDSSVNNTLHIKGNKNGDSIIVNSTNNGYYTLAVCAQNSTSVQVDGNIRITENGSCSVYGAASVLKDSSVTAGDVYVVYDNATGSGSAYGLHTDGGSLKVGDVYAANNAVVNIVSNNGIPNSFGAYSMGGTIEADSITAAATCGNAIGVCVEGNTTAADITVLGEITVESGQNGEKFDADGIFIRGAEADVSVKAQKINAVCKEADGCASGITVYTFGSSNTKKIDIECDGIELKTTASATGVSSITEGAGNENDIRINGDIIGKSTMGITLATEDGTNSITIDGNVEATQAGACFETDGGLSSLVVNGTLSGDECALYVDSTNEDDYSVSVYGLKTSETGMLANSEAVLASVNYIVHGNDGSADYKNMTFDPSQVSTVTVNGKTYYTAKEGTITVTVGSGYALKSTQGIAGSGNTYTVTIPQGGFVTLETIIAAVESSDEEQKPVTTGSIGAPVSDGIWNMAPDGTWTYRTNALFRNTWAYIGNPYANEGQAKEGWFYFDKNGIMLTGWQQLDGKWYYFNKEKDGTQGMMLKESDKKE